MSDVSPWAVGVATVATFLSAGAWYAVLGSRLARLSDAYADDPHHPAATAAVELGRGLVVSAAVAVLVARAEISGLRSLLGLAGLLFVAFPGVLLAGSVWHEKVSPALATIHAVDWLIKLLLVTLIVGLWP